MFLQLKPLYSLLFLVGLFLFLTGSSQAQQPASIAFACELPSEDISTYWNSSTFSLAGQLHKQLNTSIVIGTVDLSKERAWLVQQLNALDIPVTVWLLLAKEDGYWMNLDNYEQAAARYNLVKQWIQQNNLSVMSIGFDIELDMQNVIEFKNHSYLLLLESVVKRFGEERLQKGRAAIQKLAKQVKDDGYLLQTYVLPIIYDERIANSTFIQRLLGTVDLVDYVDVEAPMLYSTMFPYGLGIVASYGKCSINPVVGSTGGAGSAFGGRFFHNFTQFSNDFLYLLHTQEVVNLGVYSWEGAIDHHLLSPLLDVDWNHLPKPSNMDDYIAEQDIVDENRQSIQGILRFTTEPWNATKWVEQHPLEVFEHLLDFVEAWYAWKHHLYPPTFIS